MNSQKSKSVRNSIFLHSRSFRLLPVFVLLLLVLPAYAKYGGGTGTLVDPYRIATPEHLYDISEHKEDWDWGIYFKLVADIDLLEYKDVPFTPIGPVYGPTGAEDQDLWFRAVFDGDGHTISNLTCHSNLPTTGLFGGILNTEIKNLGLINVDVSGQYDVGGLAGKVAGGSISLISNCYVTGKVSGKNEVGGLFGEANSRIYNCYSTAEVSGDNAIGGLVGRADNCMIYNCYASGLVTANGPSGGLASGSGGAVIGSFWDLETSGQAFSWGGHGRTTAEMKMTSTFFGWGGCSSEGVWTIDEGKDYPRLAWEGKPGQIITGQLSDILPGSGTAVDPYLISTAEQLNSIGLFPCERNRHFRLIADIDLSAYGGMEFNIIGARDYWPFIGTFDGNRHTISNFTYDSTNQQGDYIRDFVGLFGDILTGAAVKNLGLVDVYVAGYYDVGGLAARNSGGRISNCYVTGHVSVGNRGGGLIGSNSGTVTTSWSTASVSSPWISGLGGLVGINEGTLSDCYAVGSVSAEPYELHGSGGLVGENTGQISNCYAAGPVQGPISVVGGLVGKGSPDLVVNSFWDVQNTGLNISAGGTGKATTFMLTEKTYTEAGWDFVSETANGIQDIWSISEGADYPRLSWAAVAGGPYPPDGATTVDPNVILTWAPSLTAESHDVYFGDNLADVEAGVGDTFQGNQVETSFSVGLPGCPYPAGLAPEATYYWRIDEHNAGGTIVIGQIWSFTVKPTGLIEETVEYQVSSGQDDAYASNGSLQNVSGAYLKVGSSSFDDVPYYASGMIFRNVNIPQGAEIVSAHLRIQSYNSRLSDEVFGVMQAEAADDAIGFSAFHNVGTLPKTNASVDWDLIESWVADTWYTSPDITDVVQEVIDRGGWSEGNSLTLLYSTRQREGGYRYISSFDRGSDSAPILEITYIP